MTHSVRVEIISHAALVPEQYQAIVSLCSRAYDEDFRAALDVFPDATHVLAYHDHELVSHAAWILRELYSQGVTLHSAYVEAVATEPAYQGRGYGTAVMRALAAAIRSYNLGALSPSYPAFYARLGWEAWRGPLAIATAEGLVPTPDETVMILRLPATPALDLHSMLVAPWRAGEVW